MKSNFKQIAGMTILSAVLVSPSFATDVNFHGFIRSFYDTSSSTAKYIGLIDDNGSWGGTQAGLNYSTKINSQLSIAGQLHYNVGEGELNLDWGFATFSPNNSSKIQFGKQKYPLGLITESIDVGISYPWVRPPQEMYHLELSDESPNFALESYDGLSAIYTTGDDWEFIVQPFIGQYNYKESSTTTIRKMSGLKLELSSEILTLQAGLSSSKLTIAGGPTDQTRKTVNIGAKVEIDNFLSYIEFIDVEVDNSDTFDSNAGYVTFAYTFDSLQPSITFAQLEGQKTAGAATGSLDQKSTAVALAYTFNPSTVFKMQWKNIKPDDPTTGGLIGALPAGETSADIFSFTMDVVF